MTDISRRSLLGTAGALGLGSVASAAMAGVSAPQKWDRTVNFLIIGTGFAGLAAALEAHEQGMKSVLVVDKMPTYGGNSIINGGAIAAAGTDMQKKAGIKDNADLLYSDIMKAGGGLAHPQLARHIADESVANYEWLRDKIGVKFKAVTYHGGHSVPRSHAVVENTGAGFINPMYKKCQEYGIPVELRTIVDDFVVGKNGEGKSTLVKCIMGEIPYTGTLKVGHNVKIGYFAQNQAQLLDGELTVFDTIDRVAVGDIRTKIRDILGAFMFGGEASDKKVKVLSGGEKTRLAMIRLLLEPVNLLILDEPTNHLDMKTKDILKNAIKEFDGTVIVVSHDREFLDGLVEKVYEFGGGEVKECLGGIYEFLEKKKLASLAELERTQKPEKPAQHKAKDNIQPKQMPQQASATQASPRKLSYAEQKERDKVLKRARKKVEEAEAEVSRLEGVVAAIEAELATGSSDPDIYERHATAMKQLENAMSMWELASMEAEELNS